MYLSEGNMEQVFWCSFVLSFPDLCHSINQQFPYPNLSFLTSWKQSVSCLFLSTLTSLSTLKCTSAKFQSSWDVCFLPCQALKTEDSHPFLGFICTRIYQFRKPQMICPHFSLRHRLMLLLRPFLTLWYTSFYTDQWITSKRSSCVPCEDWWPSASFYITDLIFIRSANRSHDPQSS